MNILILDTETTGLEPTKGAKLIEIGALLYNVKYHQIIQTFSTLLPCEENDAKKINHIEPEWTQCNQNTTSAIYFLYGMAKDSSFIVAHNAQFDKKFLHSCTNSVEFWDKRWICTKNDFKWPVRLTRFRLEDICIAMKVPYINAHRALADCSLIAQCFDNIPDLEQRFSNF